MPSRPTDHDEVLARVGERLRSARRRHGLVLADVAGLTGLSVSTLSRLESGKRRPTLEVLIPLAAAYRMPLDDLVGAPATGDPRVHLRPETRHGRTVVPLTRHPGPLQAFKQVLPGRRDDAAPDPVSHDGYEWLYVLSGRLRLVLGEHDLILRAGEVAEFDTHVPHWFASADDRPVEILNLFGPQGERAHITARTRDAGAAAPPPDPRRSSRRPRRPPSRPPSPNAGPDADPPE